MVMCTRSIMALVLKAAGKGSSSTNDQYRITGNVGQWLWSFTFVEANGATGSIK